MDDNPNILPNIVPVTNLLSLLPKIEVDRLLQFRAEDDMRRALIGRLMIHAFFVTHHGSDWEKLEFSRSEANKPILSILVLIFQKLKPEHLKDVSFNISHHGDWVILAGDTSLESPIRLGVDVMDFQEQVPGESFESFSSCFHEQFTTTELDYMKAAPHDPDAPNSTNNQLKRFYRMWCLKESVVKALGVGIDFNLQSFEFIAQEEETAKPITSTKMRVYEPSDNFKEEGWVFEEALLDDNHCYAIAAHLGTEEEVENGESIMNGSEIQRLGWQELLQDAKPYPHQH
ncbi:hypothetical protein BGX34_000131 [Mortierella sp. NVP85]|nr:hypothetical protein BGX34_000131 [Mortierella sp. NVP85]